MIPFSLDAFPRVGSKIATGVHVLGRVSKPSLRGALFAWDIVE
jgi:hypothetical protein